MERINSITLQRSLFIGLFNLIKEEQKVDSKNLFLALDALNVDKKGYSVEKQLG